MSANYNDMVWNAILKRGCTDPVDLQDFLDRNEVGVNLENEQSWSRFLIEKHRSDGSVWLDCYRSGLDGCTPEKFSHELADALSDSQVKVYLCCGENNKPRRLYRSADGNYQLSAIVTCPERVPREPRIFKRLLHSMFGAYQKEFELYQTQMLASQLWQLCAGRSESGLRKQLH